jgi:hypothetical protein
VPASYYTPSIWSWTEALDPGLWAIFIGTMFLAGFLIWAVDYLMDCRSGASGIQKKVSLQCRLRPPPTTAT